MPQHEHTWGAVLKGTSKHQGQQTQQATGNQPSYTMTSSTTALGAAVESRLWKEAEQDNVKAIYSILL